MKNSVNPRQANGHRRREIVARQKARVRSGVPCGICGKPINLDLRSPDPLSMVVDEIVPVSKGGNPYTLENTQPAHRWCNAVKGTKSLEWARGQVARLLRGEAAERPAAQPFRKLDI